MSSLTKIPSAFLLVACVANTALADEPHQVWWKYLKGSWTYDVAPVGMNGEATWRMATKGKALVGRFKGDDEYVGIELVGFQDGKEIVTGFGSVGDYWRLEYTKRTERRCEANHNGRLPDGTSYEGKFVCEKIDDDHWVWQFTGKSSDGKDMTMKAKFARKTE